MNGLARVRFAAILLCWVCRAQEPAEIVAAAVAAERDDPANRTRVAWKHESGMEVHYTIERDGANRVRIVAKSAQRSDEIFAGNGMVYVLDGNLWRKTPAGPKLPGVLDIPGLFTSRFTNVRERPGRVEDEPRVFVGTMSWAEVSGELEVAIDAASQRIVRLTFSGLCGRASCKFDAQFEYDPELIVQLPER